MPETTITLTDTSKVEVNSLTVVDQAREFLVIRDNDHYLLAGEKWKEVCAMMSEVEKVFDENIQRWHTGHKAALAEKAKYWNPLNDAKLIIKKSMSGWAAEQERIRQAEQRRLEEIARKAEEERMLAEAVAAEAAGDKEEAAAIIDVPAYIPPIVLEKTVPKMTGGPVYRTITKFRIVDVNLIPRVYMVPDEVKIGGVVRALKRATDIPGIEVYEERV